MHTGNPCRVGGRRGGQVTMKQMVKDKDIVN